MEFKILSHACMHVTHNNDSLLVDPWLIGSCYWRSWWNYPPVSKEVLSDLNPSAIYITHVHWDHWHGTTLKRFLNKNIQIITHYEPNKRSLRDLKNFGFDNIKILKHAESYNIGKIKITPYQFGLFLNDSALVIETPECKILNANDCKIAGASLEQIKSKHKHFDFALRSHSSANDRICYKIKNSDQSFDDPSHYTRSFKLFMDNVKPTYAIPFASNHCHLHKDVFSFNKIINDPYILKNDVEKLGGLKESTIKIMLSGDSWSIKNGFNIDNDNNIYFSNKEIKLKEYKEDNKKTLDNYYNLESKTRINDRTIKVFENQLRSIPKLLKRKLKNWSFSIFVYGGRKDYYYKVIPYNSLIEKITVEEYEKSLSKIIMPIIVFNSAINQNMFHHSGISKRNKYIFGDMSNLKKWEITNKLLEMVELEVFPLSLKYIITLIGNYFRRWREIIVYFKAVLLLRKGLKIYDVEEAILSDN